MNTGVWMILTLLLPLMGGMLAYTFRIQAARIATGFAFLALALSSLLLINGFNWSTRFLWIPEFHLGWRVDQLALVLCTLVLLISFLVHLFSVKYMHVHEHPRYFLKLGFFTTAMLGLLMADHLLLLFIFWEVVGFASYLLIGFYHEKKEAAKSAKWAFLTNRVADVALLGAILSLGFEQSFFLSELTAIPSVWIGAGLLIGAMGKSAQLPFSGWLPRAMTGPTPVSALIHAATMVAAGVYLMLRVGPFLPEVVLTCAAIVGALTAFFGAFTAVTQHDVKQVLAYSTVSQLGFMFLGIGVGAFESSFFHLWTHAFFKAGLFLAAGVLMHHVGTQDMRQMGGLGGSMKWLMTLHVICGMALAGFPLFSGFMSKEGILQATWSWAEQQTAAGYSEAHLVSYFAFFTLFLTAWYIARQVWMIYWTPSRTVASVEGSGYHWQMGIPLILLSIASLGIVQGFHVFSSSGWVMELAGFSLAAHAGSLIPFVSSGLVLIGFVHCYGLYGPRRFYVQHYAQSTYPPSIMGRLSYFGWYVDSLYDRVLSSGYVTVAKGLHWFDKKAVDGTVNAIGVSGVVFAKFLSLVDTYVVDGFVQLTVWISRQVGRLATRIQSANVQHQIAWLIFVLILLLVFLLF